MVLQLLNPYYWDFQQGKLHEFHKDWSFFVLIPPQKIWHWVLLSCLIFLPVRQRDFLQMHDKIYWYLCVHMKKLSHYYCSIVLRLLRIWKVHWSAGQFIVMQTDKIHFSFSQTGAFQMFWDDNATPNPRWCPQVIKGGIRSVQFLWSINFLIWIVAWYLCYRPMGRMPEVARGAISRHDSHHLLLFWVLVHTCMAPSWFSHVCQCQKPEAQLPSSHMRFGELCFH